MTGAKRPTIYRFIDGVKKDEAIARAKMIGCEKGDAPPPQRRRDAQRNSAIKNAVTTYLERKKEEAKQKAADNEEEEEEEEKEGEVEEEEKSNDERSPENQWCRSTGEREKWLQSPEKRLLASIAQNSSM